MQKRRSSGVAELVIITDEVEEKNFNDAMAIFEGMSVISEIAGVIRVHNSYRFLSLFHNFTCILQKHDSRFYIPLLVYAQSYIMEWRLL